MTARDLTDEILMAYADGELDEATARRVEAAALEDEEVARRVALFARTRAAVAALARARPTGPVPPNLADRVRSRLSESERAPEARIPPFQRPARSRPVELALAAGIALVVGIGTGLLVSPSPQGGAGPLLVGAPGGGDLASALAELPAGESRSLAGGEVVVIATFLNAGGELCREFEYGERGGPGAVSVACHTGEGWDIRFALATGGDAPGYAPASSLEALDAFLAATGAEPPLAEDEEAAALASLGG